MRPSAAKRAHAARRLAQHRATLIELYQTLTGELAALENRVAHLHDERSSDEMDLVQSGAPEQLLVHLEEKLRRKRREVLAALERIEDGSYGRCQHCPGQIGEARLEALPMARYCLSCQELLEQGRWDEDDDLEPAPGEICA